MNNDMTFEARLGRAQKYIKEMDKAFIKYSQHLTNCPALKDKAAPCLCGLAGWLRTARVE